ncbi:MAG: nucleotide pyrophosphohydrolase [Clostridiales bacterium]|nr:nucleotide pyrophosphohydrolase [Clostridiales bacterium]
MSLDMQNMREMQQVLQARYAGWWEPVDPEHGKNKMLWMLAELGEAIQVVKRHPADEIAKPGEVRQEFVEELADVLMYFNDIMLCFDITPGEFETVYRGKHARNMTRWKKPCE